MKILILSTDSHHPDFHRFKKSALIRESSWWDQRDRRQSRDGSGERVGKGASFKSADV